MVASGSAWRLGDSSAVAAMHDALADVIASLLGGGDVVGSVVEIGELRAAVHAVDGFDRVAVNTVTVRLRERLAELEDATP